MLTRLTILGAVAVTALHQTTDAQVLFADNFEDSVIGELPDNPQVGEWSFFFNDPDAMPAVAVAEPPFLSRFLRLDDDSTSAGAGGLISICLDDFEDGIYDVSIDLSVIEHQDGFQLLRFGGWGGPDGTGGWTMGIQFLGNGTVNFNGGPPEGPGEPIAEWVEGELLQLRIRLDWGPNTMKYFLGDIPEPVYEGNLAQICSIALGTITRFVGVAGVDNLVIKKIDAKSPCADLNSDGIVDTADLLYLLESWGECPDCVADVNLDDVIDTVDLLVLLKQWG